MSKPIDERKSPERADKEKKSPTLFTPLRPKRAFEEISAEIKRLIFSGVLKPGDRLPSEAELAGQFGVSRQTLREALRRLELSGFIATQKGAYGGPLIVDTILVSMGELFVDAFQARKITTDELTKARLDIEKMVLTNIFEVKDRESIAVIREKVDETTKKLEQGIRCFEDNIQFHRLLAGATKNSVFVILMESMMTVVAHFHSVLKMDMKTIRNAHRAHERILQAIESGDEQRAQEELKKDILNVDRTYRSLKKSSPEGQEDAEEEIF
ncbi:MAG: Pyruvate dehydrogenase complex repressor [Syntrophorhabdaceae bacterium PtaU1.Bin034]|nr:MAG: Pyruvate dehydrogenase complex repressor [Syntrophorhabdaceae bacterium PtaU1.Bin034]